MLTAYTMSTSLIDAQPPANGWLWPSYDDPEVNAVAIARTLADLDADPSVDPDEWELCFNWYLDQDDEQLVRLYHDRCL